jgi:hypothetical protein
MRNDPGHAWGIAEVVVAFWRAAPVRHDRILSKSRWGRVTAGQQDGPNCCGFNVICRTAP